MVDVSPKPVSRRAAIARGEIRLAPGTIRLIKKGLARKGDVIATARLAGIMAAKKAHDLIPLCHNILLDHVAVDIELERRGAVIEASVTSTGRTGAEMEALTAVSVAALTIYDMCKAADKQMVISGVRLLKKTKEIAQ